MKQPMPKIDRRSIVLACRDCEQGLDLPGVPPDEADAAAGDPVALARVIGAHRPDLLRRVVEFCDAHNGHEYAPMLIEPADDYIARMRGRS